jgi:hypothetical protein
MSKFKTGDIIFYSEGLFPFLPPPSIYSTRNMIIEIIGYASPTSYEIVPIAIMDEYDAYKLNIHDFLTTLWGNWTLLNITDLILYSHWSYKTERFWELIK